MNERGYALRKLQVTRFYPDFSEVDELIRFAAYLYLLALTPVLAQLMQAAPLFHSPAQIASVTASAQVAALPEVPAARPVLGETVVAPNREVVRDAVPSYPLWKVSYFESARDVVPLYTGEQELESVDFATEELRIAALEEYDNVLVVWETQYVNDIDDLYNFYVATDSTARVYLDGELIVSKETAEFAQCF